jgi:hypothetical protein
VKQGEVRITRTGEQETTNEVTRLKNKLAAIGITAIALVAGAEAQQLYCDRGPCGVNTRVYREGSNWVQEITGSITPAKALKFHSALGSVQVRGAGQQQITYTVRKKLYRTMSEEAAKREFALLNVEVYRRGPEAVYFESDWDGGYARRMGAEFVINVPQDMALVKIDTMGGSVDVKNIAGKVGAETAGGSINYDDIGGSVTAETQGGSIEVGNIGGAAQLETAGGSITIGSVGGMISANTSGGSVQVGTGKQNITIETAGGSISVKECSGWLNATTAGGSIDIGNVGGKVMLETAGGGIRLGSAKGAVKATTAGGGMKLLQLTSGVYAETAAGGIEAEFVAGRGQFTDSHLETSFGDIVVYLPSDLPVTVKAGIELAQGHNIYAQDFKGIQIVSEGGQYGPKTVYGEGNLNGGGPVLKVHTTSGNIIFKRTSSQARR